MSDLNDTQIDAFSFNIKTVNDYNVGSLRRLLSKFTYKDKWSFDTVIQSFTNCVLAIKIETEDSTGRYKYYKSNEDYDYVDLTGSIRLIPLTDKPFYVIHYFSIPMRQLSDQEIERFLLDSIINVERHEAMEFFKVDGRATFFPDHTPMGNPYMIRHVDEPAKPKDGHNVTSA